MNLKKNYFTKEPVSEFWLKALVAHDVIGEDIKPNDEPILKHLTRIEANKKEINSLSLTFHFSENAWFNNLKLSKHFELDGENINKSYGDEIEWKEGKNITVKTVKKKNKKKGGGKKTK